MNQSLHRQRQTIVRSREGFVPMPTPGDEEQQPAVAVDADTRAEVLKNGWSEEPTQVALGDSVPPQVETLPVESTVEPTVEPVAATEPQSDTHSRITGAINTLLASTDDGNRKQAMVDYILGLDAADYETGMLALQAIDPALYDQVAAEMQAAE